jgi:hypothetical protein
MRIVLLASLLFAACTVGEVGTSNNMTDGGMTEDFTLCTTRLAQPNAAHTHAVGGTSNKGQNCIAAGCHLNNNLGAGAPGFQFAGTLYATGGVNPQAGAAVRIKAGTMVLKTFTDADGNFYFNAGSLQGNFTANTNVSGCPTITNMVGTLGGGGGAGANSCNLCHTTGAGAQAPPITM